MTSVQQDRTETDAEFRARLRNWFNANPGPEKPPLARPGQDLAAEHLREQREWQQRLHAAGLAGLAWPVVYGGQGATAMQQLIFHEEHQRVGGRGGEPFLVAVSHAGPTIIARGTEEQRREWLPPILRGESIFAQCFSEPGAGSDLAAVSTRAVVDGDELVINGHKIWNTFAQHADLCELLVRTDDDRYGGLTYLIADMGTPGITVRPITTITGRPEFCEVFFDDVRVPLRNVLGDIDQGWQVATTTLLFERSTTFAALIIGLQRLLGELADRYRGDPVASAHITGLSDDVFATRALLYKSVAEQDAGGEPGPATSALKLLGSEVNRAVRRFIALLNPDDAAGYLASLGLCIGGGTSEVQRNIIAERVLGLPREPRR